MMEGLEMISGAGVWLYVVVGILLLVFSLAVIRGIRKAKSTSSVKRERTKTVDGGEEAESLESIGEYKAMVFRQGNVLDFINIPEPIGEIYQFDPSCPISGMGYIVKETPGGELVDYDPREIEVLIEQTPEFAWSATHPEEVTRNFWMVPTQWWKSTATWFAIAMLIIVFITSLVVFD